MNEELELPQGWTVATIGEVGEIVTGTTPNTKHREFYGGDIAFFKPTDLNLGFHVDKADTYLTTEGAEEARVLPPKSVLVTCIGATIGKTGFSRVPSATNQQINAVVPNLVVPEYLYFTVISPDFNSQIIDNASSTTLPILNKSRFSQLEIPLPPLEEQKRIAGKLEKLLARVDVGLEHLNRVPDILKRFRQAVLAAAT
ncbi:MAG: restriction endonuclease subunit S, partial [Trueperaceae bacterium]